MATGSQQLKDNFGRKVVFQYTNGGALSGFKDPAGSIIKYATSSIPSTREVVFSEVTYADGTKKKYTHGEGTSGAAETALTGIYDENNDRYATFEYSFLGNAVSSELAGGVDKYMVWEGSSVMRPTGQRLYYSTQNIAGMLRVTEELDGNYNFKKSFTYDAVGNLTSRDDFTNKRTCYTNDPARNLESSRVEGLDNTEVCSTVTPANAVLPTGSRKVSTSWHPDWILESRRAESGQITTYVYNGQPDPTAGNAVVSCAPASALLPDGKPIAVLCKKVEQATTDANGAAGFAAASQAGVAARVWKWTYNQYGQVLTEDGPRTDVSDITTYTYHAATAFTGVDPNAVGVTLGDLKSVTNAAGKTTNYTKYNKHGQLLESSDPNGVVSSFTYDLRQRLLSATVGGLKTSYAYDAAGQLKRVTRPDTSWTGYDYDPAHRLVAVYDNLGNRIDYTLDNAGNRTAENVKDPGGLLKRQLARSIDALGRVQQTTGLE